MIATNWIHTDPIQMPQVVDASRFLSLELKVVGAIRRILPRSATVRSRKGMKGGEQDGHEEGG